MTLIENNYTGDVQKAKDVVAVCKKYGVVKI